MPIALILIHSNTILRKKSGKIKTAYKMDYVHLNCDLDLDFAGPTIHGAAVLGQVFFFSYYR